MTNQQPFIKEKRATVQKMFGRIAQTYDLLNKIISLGQDAAWRKKVVRLIQPEKKQTFLDIGCGTGDLASTLINAQPDARVVAADFSIQMIQVGKSKNSAANIDWIVADAQALPFKSKTFHGVVSGYLLRNVTDQKKALTEQNRVMRIGARVAALDTTPPTKNWYYPFVMAYIYIVIPFLGFLLSGDLQAYSYLPRSTSLHTPADQLAGIFTESGFENVGFIKVMFGTMAIHFGRKPVAN